MNPSIQTEQEAAVAILFSCVLHGNRPIGQGKIEHLSRMLVLSSKFRQTELNEVTTRVLPLISELGNKNIIEQAAPFITDNFRETLFAMVCEVITDDGTVNESESEIVGLTALYLGISIELMRMMLTVYLMRNRWNVQVID